MSVPGLAGKKTRQNDILALMFQRIRRSLVDMANGLMCVVWENCRKTRDINDHC